MRLKESTRFLLLVLILLLPFSASYIIKRWPLSETIPVEDLRIDGSACGPNGTAMCVAWDTGTCHDPLSECNQCRSNDPHIFYITWCADTRGFGGITCDIDLGYRSPEGARHGLFEYSIKGRNSTNKDFSNRSTVVFPDSPFPFSNFAVDSGKNNILTVFQLSMVEGNTEGDNLELTDTSGFCCRATFSGGKTVTGTLYIGDLTIRANSLAASPSASPSAFPPISSPSPSSTTAAANNIANDVGYSGGALGGSIFGGVLIGVIITLTANTILSRGGINFKLHSSTYSTKGPTITTSLLNSGTSRAAQIEKARI